jgi:hypothetical protein
MLLFVVRIQGQTNCDWGTYADGSGNCVPCREGTYKSNFYTDESFCIDCPVGKWSDERGRTLSDCDVRCPPGYEGNPVYGVGAASICTQCTPGKYYDVAFFHANELDIFCHDCESGKYQPDSGQSACLECDANMKYFVTPYGGFCACIAGAQPSATTSGCDLCPIGSYKTLPGTGSCTKCIDVQGHTMTTESTGSTGGSDCLCPAGYEGELQNGCWPCWPGTYSSYPGNYDRGDQCQYCPLPGQWSGTAAVQCVCNAGYEPWNGQCVGCIAGKYKETISDEPCTQCGPFQTTFVSGGGVATSRQQCECQPGYTSPTSSPDSLCSACPRGKYQIFAFSGQPCQDCPVGGTTVTTGSAFDLDCIADAGYYEVGRVSFLPCAPGTYRTYTAAEGADYSIVSCLQCPYKTTSPLASTSQIDCICSTPEHIAANPPCVCAPGYYLNSTDECEICEAGVYCSGQTKYNCPEHSTSLEGSGSIEECNCIGGWKNSNNQCESCNASSFWSGSECSKCPVNTEAKSFSTDISQCLAAVGYYMQGGVSVQCPVGSTSLGGGDSFSNCTALSGFYTDGLEFHQCVDYSSSSPGSTSIADCLCLPGYEGFAGSGGSCEACGNRYFKADWADGSCTMCHANSATETLNSTAESQCLCLPGYYAAIGSTECLPCEVAKFKTELSNTESCDLCEDFRFFSTTRQVASTSSADCLCDMGRFLKNDECEACGWGFYKEYVGNSACRNCSYGHSTVSSVSTSPDDCVCGRGFQAVGESY